jgi:hypothetical protein
MMLLYDESLTLEDKWQHRVGVFSVLLRRAAQQGVSSAHWLLLSCRRVIVVADGVSQLVDQNSGSTCCCRHKLDLTAVATSNGEVGDIEGVVWFGVRGWWWMAAEEMAAQARLCDLWVVALLAHFGWIIWKNYSVILEELKSKGWQSTILAKV